MNNWFFSHLYHSMEFCWQFCAITGTSFIHMFLFFICQSFSPIDPLRTISRRSPSQYTSQIVKSTNLQMVYTVCIVTIIQKQRPHESQKL